MNGSIMKCHFEAFSELMATLEGSQWNLILLDELQVAMEILHALHDSRRAWWASWGPWGCSRFLLFDVFRQLSSLVSERTVRWGL